MDSSDNYWSRTTRGRSSRRRILGAGAAGAVGLASLATVGCGGNDGGGGAAVLPTSVIKESLDAPKQGGTWRNYGDAVNEPHDPTLSTNTAASFWLYIGDRAIDVEPTTNQLTSSLIEKWEQPSPDRAILHVRPNVKWHNKAPVNGRAVTAEDIATSLLAHAGRLDSSGGKAVYPRKGSFSLIDKIEAQDEKTVVMTMKAANNGILAGLADWRLPMFPKEQLTIGFADSNKLIGSGPWVAEPGYATGTDFKSDYVLTRNAEYWDKPRPYYDHIESTINQDQAARTTAFLADKIDVLATFRSPYVEIQSLIARKPDAQFVSWKFGHWHYTRFNTQKAPWTDPRVRRAIFLALNHGAIGDGFYGNGNWQFTGPLPYTFGNFALSPEEVGKLAGWNPTTKDKDIAEAKQLMSAAGFPEGEITVSDLVFSLAQNTANTTRVKDQLEKVWPKIKFTIDGKPDSATFYAQTAKMEYDLQCASIYPVPDPVSELIGHYGTAGGRNYGKYSNSNIDTKLTAALAEFNNDALKGKLLDIQKVLIEDMPTMTHYAANLTALYGKTVRGLKDAHGPGVSSAAVKRLSSAQA